jgi:hypothetical protein
MSPHLSRPGLIHDLRADLARSDATDLQIKVRYQLKVADHELEEFLHGSHRPAGGKRCCVALDRRIEMIPTGETGSCHLVLELTMGNLHECEVAEIRRGPAYQDIRTTTSQCGLMPVCAKCDLRNAPGM